jgi:hypothetical protein
MTAYPVLNYLFAVITICILLLIDLAHYWSYRIPQIPLANPSQCMVLATLAKYLKHKHSPLSFADTEDILKYVENIIYREEMQRNR